LSKGEAKGLGAETSMLRAPRRRMGGNLVAASAND
jgi:hypothetical protein